MDIHDRTKRIIADKLGLDEDKITSPARFKEDLGVDSLDLIEMMMQVEKDFKISIPDEIVERINTVGDVFQYLEKQGLAIAPVRVV